MTTSVKTAVIGLGRMGMHHVRACVDTDGIDLVAVLDHKPDWAVQVGAETHSLVAADVDSLVGKIDQAIIAVPTADHSTTAVPLLRAGVSCLIEKPIAATEDDASVLISAAKDGNAKLQVGHTERFNPAIEKLRACLAECGAIKEVSVQRHNPPQDRPYDVDAILDLMIHDLDMLPLLISSSVDNIVVIETATPHKTAAQLTCDDGTRIQLSVDRQASAPVRDMTVKTEDETFHLDFSTQSLERQSAGGSDVIAVESGDALRRQLRDFSASTRGIGASGLDGLNALRLANRVRAAAGLT